MAPRPPNSFQKYYKIINKGTTTQQPVLTELNIFYILFFQSDKEENDVEEKEEKENEETKEGDENGEIDEGDESVKVVEQTDKPASATKSKSVSIDDENKPRPLHKTASIFLRNLAPTITKAEVEAVSIF